MTLEELSAAVVHLAYEVSASAIMIGLSDYSDLVNWNLLKD